MIEDLTLVCTVLNIPATLNKLVVQHKKNYQLLSGLQVTVAAARRIVNFFELIDVVYSGYYIRPQSEFGTSGSHGS